MSEPLYGLHGLSNEQVRRAAVVAKVALEIMDNHGRQLAMELDDEKKRFECAPDVYTYLNLAIDLIRRADSAIDSHACRERAWVMKSA